jgi:hypothetical protein
MLHSILWWNTKEREKITGMKVQNIYAVVVC